MIDVNFNGVSGYITHEVVWKSSSRPVRAPVIKRETKIPFKHGTIDHSENDYDKLIIPGTIQYKGISHTNLRAKAREIAVWLSTAQQKELIFSDEPDKYYMARVYNQIDETRLAITGKAEVIFECQPFAYAVTPVNYTQEFIGAANLVFANAGIQQIDYKSPEGSKFDIVIDGSFTNITLTLNGKSLTYSGPVSAKTITIDNVDMEVDLDGVNALASVTGEIDTFLHIIPGENTLAVTGTGLNCTIDIDFIPLY